MIDKNQEKRIPLLVKPKEVIAYDPESNSIVRGRKVIKQMGREKGKMLGYLLKHPGQVQTANQIVQAINPEEDIFQNRDQMISHLRPLVCRMRKDLKEIDGSLPGTIKTVRGTGFVYDPHESTGVGPKRLVIQI